MRDMASEKNYWKNFYKEFTDYLYYDRNCFDNYVGGNIKLIRTFFTYLNRDLGLGIGDFHKQFYVRKEAIAIQTLLPEELNFLISNKPFESRLSPYLKKVKDIFVFGCTVALRASDLMCLTISNIRENNGIYYLVVRSQKTSTDTLVKLPPYIIEIISKYRKLKERILPDIKIYRLNVAIKILLEKAGFVQQMYKRREKGGQVLEIHPRKPDGSKGFRFCDLASTHIMRRTAITTMLSLGMPESMVRRISGHAPGSKEFYRYVNWAQSYQDQETEKMFEKLQQKKLRVTNVSDLSALNRIE